MSGSPDFDQRIAANQALQATPDQDPTKQDEGNVGFPALISAGISALAGLEACKPIINTLDKNQMPGALFATGMILSITGTFVGVSVQNLWEQLRPKDFPKDIG